jgi:serine/threonine protein phosphatase PrpC
MLDVQFGQASDFGKVRTNNEDAMGSFIPSSRQQGRSHGFLFVVADGVGGMDLGEVASATAVSVMTEQFAKAQPGSMLISLMPRLIEYANSAVHDRRLQPEYRGKNMATTLVACALRYDQAIVSHVGDSRCYLIRRGVPNLLTRDHTVANEHLRLKLISKEDAAQAETRHMLSRSLGAELMVNVEINEHQVFVGDVLLLCSDGLHGSVEATEMAALTSHGGDLAVAAKRMVEIANQRDGSDNISLQLIRVKSVERVGMYRGRPYRLP